MCQLPASGTSTNCSVTVLSTVRPLTLSVESTTASTVAWPDDRESVRMDNTFKPTLLGEPAAIRVERIGSPQVRRHEQVSLIEVVCRNQRVVASDHILGLPVTCPPFGGDGKWRRTHIHDLIDVPRAIFGHEYEPFRNSARFDDAIHGIP
jgi:hypothetical protein